LPSGSRAGYWTVRWVLARSIGDTSFLSRASSPGPTNSEEIFWMMSPIGRRFTGTGLPSIGLALLFLLAGTGESGSAPPRPYLQDLGTTVSVTNPTSGVLVSSILLGPGAGGSGVSQMASNPARGAVYLGGCSGNSGILYEIDATTNALLRSAPFNRCVRGMAVS